MNCCGHVDERKRSSRLISGIILICLGVFFLAVMKGWFDLTVYGILAMILIVVGGALIVGALVKQSQRRTDGPE